MDTVDVTNCRDRFAAAKMVRALACQTAAKLACYSDSERLAIVERAEALAQTLERPYTGEDGAEAAPPWRLWLQQAGYGKAVR